MTILVAALTLRLDLGALLQRANAAPPQVKGMTCNIATVSYRFVGEPGTELRYAGNRYIVPAEGSIEVLATKGETEYQVAGGTRPLEVWPRDSFGTRTVPLPKRQ